MRLCAALAVVLVALLVVTARGLRRKHMHPPPQPQPEAAEISAPLTAAATFPSHNPAPPAPREGTGGIARLRGRVLFPAGVEPARNLEVVAEDPTRRVLAQIQGDGRFDIHLPSGRYTLIATMGDLVGVVPDVLARGESTRDVDIRLGPGATIRGKLRAQTSAVQITTVQTGRDDEAGEPLTENDSFSVDGLIAGRSYDLTFHGKGVRALTITGVTAPADGLDVEMQPRAKVSGAIGFPRGERCPITHVELRSAGGASDDDDETSADVGKNCAFALSVPDQTAAVTVVATGDGWYLEEQVVIPPDRDPAPICLNPPCRSDPSEGRARLRLTLESGGEPSPITADVTPTEQPSGGGSSYHSCAGSDGRCDIEDLDAGDTFSITATGRDCRSDPMTVTVVAGDNHVRIPCLRERRIEGVIRIPEDQRPDRVVVRCAGGDLHPLTGTRLFRLTCGADVGALEYQIGSEGTWRSVPIASVGDPAFIDIGSF